MSAMLLGGRYQVQDKIGAGGMATVYRGLDEVLGRTVAIKTMLPQYANDPSFAARFKQEAQAAAALQSPYIVSVYDWGKDADTYYIVMEYLRGTDLKSGIRKHGALDCKKVAQIGSQIAQALSVAHRHDIIHRDIKPQNIMVQPDGNIKVMDFGIARAKNSHLTQDNSVLGTAHYVSPEQTQGKELGPTTDIYSLGIVMYEAATGQVPFQGDDAISVALKQVNEQPKPPSQLNPNVDPQIEAIILKCMQKNPADRFQTADELYRTLRDYLAGRMQAVNSATAMLPAQVTNKLDRGAAVELVGDLGGEHRGRAVDGLHAPGEVVAQGAVELVGGLEAVRRVLLHALEDDGLDLRVHVGVELAGRLGLLVHLLEGDGDGVVALEGHLAGGRLVHDDAEGVDVGRGPELLALGLLGGDVVGGAEDRVVLREVAVLRPGDAEVHHLDVAVGLHHDVLRLDVAVDDVVTVRHGERLRDLGADLGDLLAVERAMLADAALEVGAAQVLHDDVVGVGVLAPVVDAHDVGALQRRGGLGLLLEARRERGVVRVLGQHGLYRHRAPEHLVEPAVDRGHAARADLVLDLVASAE